MGPDFLNALIREESSMEEPGLGAALRAAWPRPGAVSRGNVQGQCRRVGSVRGTSSMDFYGFL